MKKDITEQLYLKIDAPLDAKLTPVNNVSDLYTIPRAERYLGMTVVVLNTGTGEDPCEYWLPKDTRDAGWVKKDTGGGQPIDLRDYYTSAQTDNVVSEAIADETARTESVYLKQESLDDYYTSAQTDNVVSEAIADETARTESVYLKQESLNDYYTSAQTDSAIASAMNAETARTESVYLKNESLTDYYTSAQTDSAISVAVKELTDIIDEDGKIIAQAFALETARTETTYFKNEDIADYYTSAQTESAITEALESFTGGTTSAETIELISEALEDYSTSAETESAITEVTEELQKNVDENAEVTAEALTQLNTKFSKYYTSGETDDKIASALTDYMTVSALTEIFSVLEKKPALVYEHDTINPICGQTGNLYSATVWHTLTDVDLSNYERLRIFVNPSTHSISAGNDNMTSALVFEVSLDDASITTDVPYYSGGAMAPSLNNPERLYCASFLVKNDSDVWKVAFKTVSLYGTTSTDVTDSYVYKIEGVYDSSNTLINPVTTYSGSGLPNPQDGNNGDLYLQTE